MTDPRQLSELDLQRAARTDSTDPNHRVIRSTNRPKKQRHPGPVQIEADLHLTLAASSEQQGREWMLELQEALVKRGCSVVVSPVKVVPAQPKPRRFKS